MAPQAAQQQKTRILVKTPSILFVCGCMLAAFACISILSSPLLDLDRFPRGSRQKRSNVTLKESRDYHGQVATNLSHVPVKGSIVANNIWVSVNADLFYGCSIPSSHFFSIPKHKNNGYVLIAASGGLNQQRTGITDAVVVAWILNATLVIPKLDHNSFWKDPSNFTDIFDADWFISSLLKYVTVVKELPEDAKYLEPYSMRVPRKSPPDYYLTKVLPVLQRRHVVELTKFDYRLANNLQTDLQKLRCMVNYHALQFTKGIAIMGQILVHRMRMMSSRYVAIHLRFEPDMLAFSGCYYGGGETERMELGRIRQRWKTLPEADAERERRHGKCPLTPEEVGLMLRGLGFGNDTYVYVASGEIYGGEATLRPLRDLFPNFYTKDTLLSQKELEPFSKYSSRMAALDYTVCDESTVFVTNNNGNMAKILAGRRRFFGHKRTIRPNARRLNSLLSNWHEMGWDEFAKGVMAAQKGFMGDPDERQPGRGEFHEYPSACICEKKNAKDKIKEIEHKGREKRKQREDSRQTEAAFETTVVDNGIPDPFLDEAEDPTFSRKKEQHFELEETSFTQKDDPELEELLSD